MCTLLRQCKQTFQSIIYDNVSSDCKLIVCVVAVLCNAYSPGGKFATGPENYYTTQYGGDVCRKRKQIHYRNKRIGEV